LLTFMGDCDGPAGELLASLAREAAPGLRRIFSCCRDFPADAELISWMERHAQAPAANYVNWLGRTVRQVREEAALRGALVKYVRDHQDELAGDEPQAVRAKLLAHAEPLRRNGTIPLTPAPRTPLGWSLRNALHFAIIPGALVLPWLLAAPFLVPLPPTFLPTVVPFLVLAALAFVFLLRSLELTIALIAALGLLLIPMFVLFPVLLAPVLLAIAVFVVVLRRYETSEPEIIHRPEVEHILELSALEDHDVTNQFTAFGSVKPSLFRRGLFVGLLWFIDYFTRHVFTRGHLGRIRTIHFARWVFLEGKTRMVFASNYDGSHEAYMDDFINKAGWGLNLAFGCALGYPRTRWLILDGAGDEMKFKYTQRRHQQPTESWYRAYPGLTVYDLERNARVRAGFERAVMSDAEARAWLSDL
jgi:hypothetical protein